MDDKDNFSKYKGEAHLGADHSAPCPVSRLAPQISLVDLAGEIAQADTLVNVRVSAKLQVIADQIRMLQGEARAVLEAAARDQQLHNAQCSFRKIAGRVYHLYRKADGSAYFSQLSPDEWNGHPPHVFIDSYLLQADMSWLALRELQARDQEHDTRDLVKRLLALSPPAAS